MTPRPDRIGLRTHGSLSGGVEVKLDAEESIEAIVAGTFVVIQQRHGFFSMITDAANESILLNPPGAQDELLRALGVTCSWSSR